MTIIVYSSKSGSSEKYAKSLSEATGFDCFSVKDSYPSDQMVVFFGWLRGKAVVGLDKVDRSKLKAVCVVGLEYPDMFNRKAISDANEIRVPVYYLQGWIIRKRLGVFTKIFFAVICAKMKLDGLNDRSQRIFDAMMEGGSFYDESFLAPIVTFCGKKKVASDDE